MSQASRIGIASSYGLPGHALARAYDAGVRTYFWGALRHADFGTGLRALVKRDASGVVVDAMLFGGLVGAEAARNSRAAAIPMALGSLDVRAVVTLGPAVDRARFVAPPNAVLVSRASHADLLREAHLVITHGGHGTVLRALAAGVPLVLVPMGRDQPDDAARVVHLGAGVRLRPTASVRALREAVARALSDGNMLAAARGVAAAITRERARDLAVTTLQQLSATP